MAFTFNDDSLYTILNKLCSTRYINNFRDTFFKDIVSFDKYKNSTTPIFDRDIEFQHIIINDCKCILDILLRNPEEADIQLDTKLLVDPSSTTDLTTIKFNYFSSIHNTLTKSNTITNILSKLINIISHLKIYYSTDYSASTFVTLLSNIFTKYETVEYDERSFINFTLYNLIMSVDSEYVSRNFYNTININNVSQECKTDLVKLGMNYFNNIQSIYNYLGIANSLFTEYNEYINSTEFSTAYYDEASVVDSTKHYNIANICLMVIVLTISIIAEYDQFKAYYNEARF